MRRGLNLQLTVNYSPGREIAVFMLRGETVSLVLDFSGEELELRNSLAFYGTLASVGRWNTGGLSLFAEVSTQCWYMHLCINQQLPQGVV